MSGLRARRYPLGVFVAVLVLGWAVGIARAQTDGPLRIGVIPALTKGQTKVGIDKLTVHLTQQLRRPVSTQVFADYAAVVAALGFGHIDMAYLGPRTYVIANHRYGARAILTQLVKGEPFYYSYFIAPADSPLTSIQELRGKQVAFADPSSTSGSLIPKLALRDLGIDAARDLRALHTGAHDATALAVQHKQVDAGAIDSAFFDLLIEQGKIRKDAFKIIWRSERLFQYPWAVRKDMTDGEVEAIRAAFLGVTDKDIFNAFGATGFTRADPDNYDVIRRAAKAFGDLD